MLDNIGSGRGGEKTLNIFQQNVERVIFLFIFVSINLKTMLIEYKINSKYTGMIYVFEEGLNGVLILSDIIKVIKNLFIKETGEKIESLSIFEKKNI